MIQQGCLGHYSTRICCCYALRTLFDVSYMLFQPSLVRTLQVSSPFYRWGNGESVELSYLPKDTLLKHSKGPYTTIPVLFLLQQNCLFCSMCWPLLDCPLFCNLAFIYFSGISNLLIPSLMHLFTTGHSHFTLFPKHTTSLGA